MKLRKSSMGLQVVIVLIVAIVFAFIFFFWLKDFRTTGENLSDYQICKNSNFENAKLKLKVDNLVLDERSGNRCKTEYLTVPKDQEVNFIARSLASCWDQYLEGKETLFDTEDNTYCSICSVLIFEEQKEITGLTSYLMKERVPWKIDQSYSEYLSKVSVKSENLESVKNAELDGELSSINTEYPWAVMFVEGKDVNPGSFLGISSIEGAGFFGALGAIAWGTVGFVAVVGGAISCPFTFGAGCALTVATIAAAGGVAAFGGVGYLVGSDLNPDLDSRVLLWRYTNDDLREVGCTMLEGAERLKELDLDQELDLHQEG